MLYKEDTNWLELVDAVRRDRATVLLARGARLGFSYAGALRGALRRWHRNADD
jgi:hypothetical protein